MRNLISKLLLIAAIVFGLSPSMWAAKYSYIYITGEVRADDGSSTSNVGWYNYKRVEVAVDGCIHIYADGNFKCSIKDFGNESGSFSNWNDFNGSNKEYLVCFGENWGTTDFGNNGNYGDNTVGNNHYVKLKPRDDGKFDLTKQTTSTLPIVKVIGFVNESSTSWDSNGVEISLDEGCKTASGSFTLYNGENFRIKIGDTEYGPAKDGTSITLGEAANYTASSNAWQLAKGKKYNIIVDNQAITVTQNIVDVYLVGDVAGGWNTSDEWKFDTTDGVTYTLTGKNMTAKKNFKLLTSAGAWYGNGDTDISVPYNKALTTSGGNMQLSSNANNVNITFNLSTGAFSIESAVTYDTYKLNIGGNEVTMSTSDGATYTASSTLSAGKTISLVNSTSGTTLYPSESATYKGGEVTYTMTGAAGNAITTDNVNNASFSGNYSFTYTVADNTLVVNGAVATYTYDKYYVKYTTNNWSSGSYGSHEMTRQADGTYTYTLTNPTTAWELAMQDNSQKDFWTDSEDNTYTGGIKSFSMKNHDENQSKNIKFGEGLSGDYLLTYNPTTETLTISGEGTPSVDKYYVKYSSDGWNSHEMTRQSDGTYTYTMTNPSNGCELAMQDNSKKDFWTDETDVNYTGGTKSFSMKGTSSKNIKFGEGLSGDYILTYNPTAKTLTISGTEPEAKPYYFVGDMNDWFSKEFTDPTAPQGMNKDVMNANKDKWEFTFIDEIPGKGDLGKGWYKFDFSAHGYECLTGQFQIFDGTDALWEGEVYSHNPYVSGYGNNGGKDHNSFKAYINRPISSEMISNETVMTTSTTKGGNPAIRRSQGSNFHLGCNAVRNAKIYFKPGNDPRLIVSGTPEDYYIFYSKDNKTQDTSDGKVTAQIVNGKPNTNNYYLPGVKYDNVALPNYINEDSNDTAAHMNTTGIDLVEFDFSAANIETTFDSKAFISMFNTASVGGMTLDDFKNNLKNNQKLPNGISLSGRTTVYVQKIPNGFEYPAGRKYALQFINAFSSSDKDVLTPVAASNLYFFNDAVHVHFNIDNYENGAQEKDRFVKMYYRIYTYDEEYNTVVIDSDNGNTTKIHSKGEEIGLTAGSSTKDLGWVALNEKKAPTAWNLTAADTGYPALAAWNVAWVSGNPGNRKHIDSKYGNCYVQFKVETGPNPSQASVANRANAEESDSGTLYIPERALIRNTPEFYTFNGKDLYVALDGGYTTTDVEDVFEDQIVEEGVDAEPIFFNLQGQRVVNPEKGMYIVVKGNKTYKVMIK